MATNGANCKNARYSYLITEPSVGFASIATGGRPSEHGIVSDFWYRRTSNEVVGSLDDPEQSFRGRFLWFRAHIHPTYSIAAPCPTRCV